jgi:hypothetical protein
MKKVWKWILGIAIALVVVGLIVGAVFVVQRGVVLRTQRAPFAYRQYQQQAVPNNPGNTNPQNNPASPANPVPNNGFPRRNFGYGPMMDRGYGYGYGPMMMGRGFSPFGMYSPFGMMGFMFFGFFRLLIPLIVLALVAWMFYTLGKRAGMSSVTPPPAAPAPVPASDQNPQN